MVHPLTPPNYDSIELISDVVGERQNGRNRDYFNGLALEWEQRVQVYLQNAGSPGDVPTWTAILPHKETFIRLYSHPAEGSAQGLILNAMRSHTFTFCPACGELGKPNTLDHYLPKGKYPHFAIIPHNLFPMCDACQAAKLEKTGDDDNPKFFIHPYYDRFSSQRTVMLDIEPPFNTPTFVIKENDVLSDDEKSLVASHLRELEISTRFADFFKEEYLRLLRLVSNMRANGQNCAASLQMFKLHANMISPNSWQHIMYDSVVNNPELMNYLTNAELPAML